MKKITMKTRIMSLVAAAVMTCSVAAVSMVSASAATVDTQSVGALKTGTVRFTFVKPWPDKGTVPSDIKLCVWDENGDCNFINSYWSNIDWPRFDLVNVDCVKAAFVRVKQDRIASWDDDSIVAYTRTYDIDEILDKLTRIDI